MILIPRIDTARPLRPMRPSAPQRRPAAQSGRVCHGGR